MTRSDGEEPEAVEGSIFAGHAGRMLILLTAGLATVKLGRYLLPPLLPEIIDSLAISSVEAGIALTTLSLLYGLFQYPGGRYADKLTRKTVLVAAFGFTLVGYLLISQTFHYAVLLIGAGVIGIGMGLYGPTDRAAISDLFTRRRGLAFGINVTGTEISGGVAAGLSVIALMYFGWRSAFIAAFAIGVVLVLLLHRWGRGPYRMETVPLGIRDTVSRLAAGKYLPVVIVYVLFSFIGQGVVGFLPTLLQVDQGFTPTRASLVYASVFGVGLLIKPVAGQLSDRVRRLTVTIGSFVVGALGLIVLLLANSVPIAVLGTVGYAIGHRSFPPVMQAYLMDRFPDETMGGDLGAIRTVYIAIGSLGPTYVGYVATQYSYTAAYAGFVACFVVGIALLAYQLVR